MRGITKDLRKAYAAAERTLYHGGEGKYARGLSAEGYAGGYLQALRDVDAALRGIPPSGSRYWPTDQ